ncbi:MAG: MmgE/PrpD family protein [Granulosicoccus sp.]|nr:MmgE/PrpD family protein [Granulosicoccus sp.]
MIDDAGIGISRRIANYAIGTRFENPLSAEFENSMNCLSMSLLDWLAVGRAGVEEPVSTLVRTMNMADGGLPQASIFGSTTRLPLRLAAQINGTTTHALDYDDTHFLHVGHTSVVVMSSTLAIAEAQGASVQQMLEAALIGSEIACHVGHWLGRSHYRAGFHQTATAGVFGATASACRLMKLDIDTTLHALGVATTMASGLTSQFGTMGKPFHAGMAAGRGIEAALLAANGFVSRTDALECAQGFALSHHADPANLGGDMFELGDRSVFADVQHKYHACCHGLHASLEALAAVQSKHHIEAEDIHRIEIATNPRWLSVCNIQDPVSALESKFSYRHVTALLLSGYDTAALGTYTDALCNDEKLQALRNRVAVHADNSLLDTEVMIQIENRDGSTLKHSLDLATPLALEARQERILKKCRSLIGEDKTATFWSLIRQQPSMSAAEFARITVAY